MHGKEKKKILIRKAIAENSPEINLSTITNKRLKHNQNSIIFRYASLFEENGYKANYSYKLENYDEKWSGWQNTNESHQGWLWMICPFRG